MIRESEDLPIIHNNRLSRERCLVVNWVSKKTGCDPNLILRLGFFCLIFSKIMKIVVILITVLLLLAIYVPVYSDDIPSRIISLGPVITEELFLLGAGDNVVGVTIHCIKPDKAKDI